jgi:DNA-binding response OmpR family regulator
MEIAPVKTGSDIRMPFNIRETVAWVEDALRRRARERGKPAEFSIGDLQIDLLHRRVSHGGRDIHLSAKTFEVLRLFVEARGRTLTHREIVRRV